MTATVSAISSTLIMRSARLFMLAARAVATKPGRVQESLMPKARTSSNRLAVNPCSACVHRA